MLMVMELASVVATTGSEANEVEGVLETSSRRSVARCPVPMFGTRFTVTFVPDVALAAVALE